MNYSHFTATHRSDRKQLDISQLLSQVLNLRDTDREHRAKVCVLAPLAGPIKTNFDSLRLNRIFGDPVKLRAQAQLCGRDEIPRRPY